MINKDKKILNKLVEQYGADEIRFEIDEIMVENILKCQVYPQTNSFNPYFTGALHQSFFRKRKKNEPIE